MGCGSSRLEELNGVLTPAKVRPLFLRLEEIRLRRRNHEAIKDQSSSSEQGLIHSGEDLDNEKHRNECSDDASRCLTPKGSNEGSESTEKGLVGDAKIEDGGDHEEEDDEDDGRKIGRCESNDYPGSPSFRVYYVEDNSDNKSEEADDELAEKSPVKDEHNSLPEVTGNQVLVRKEKKRRNSFKKVIMLPKGRHAKNLFNNVPFLHSSNHSNPDRTHLLTAKAHA